jgi:diguanylate cyclase (GGDEF)-like protein
MVAAAASGHRIGRRGPVATVALRGRGGLRMSFRGRLRVFFTLIVLVPLVVVTAVAFALTASSEHGKADAGLAAGLQTALGLHREAVAAARPALRRVGGDERLQGAIVAGDDRAAERRMRQLVDAPGGPVAIVLRDADGARTLAAAGMPTAIAPQVAALDGPGAASPGTLAVSAMTSAAFARRVERLTNLPVAVYRDGRRLATTDPKAPTTPPAPDRHALTIGDADYRVRSGRVSEAVGPPLDLLLLRPASGIENQIANNRLAILALVGVFLVAAIAAASLVGRALTTQIARFLAAARRLGRGDFSRPVPVRGRDEFAELGREFNSMSDQLERNIAEVERKRGELEEMIRRVGDALATGLERQGVVELAVRTAVNACEAQTGRAIPTDSARFDRSESGPAQGALGPALEAAERLAFRPDAHTARELLGTDHDHDDGRPPRRRRAVTATVEGAEAAAVVMRSVVGGTGSEPEYLGVLSIARRGAPFTPEQLELLEYLAGQAVVSIENASLHEAVERQAVTDELTGLANKRAFHSIFDRELERSRRFETPLGLVMLDIDKFKSVNDTYGHQQGDAVLAAVAGVVRSLSRDVDAPARYGGEEMAVILPGTDAEGAVQLAERMREAVEALSVPKLGDSGLLQVTASFGAGAVPESAADKDGLIAAADAALYRAKHNGRNRVEAAEPAGARR